jgi:hypothetical protein
MDTLDEWRTILEKTLQFYADLPDIVGDVSTYLVVSRDSNHFFLIREGWQGNRRIHGMVVHAEIRDHKIWIHYDGIEGSITEELVAAGIPKENIVLAFHPPYVREHTGYAVA